MKNKKIFPKKMNNNNINQRSKKIVVGTIKSHPRQDQFKYGVGLDLGGTKLAGALVRSDGKIISFLKTSVLETKSHPNPREGIQLLIDQIVEMILSFQKQHPHLFSSKLFSGVGVASAGPLNVLTGTLIDPINFPLWKKVPIIQLMEKNLLKKNLHCPIYFQNDAVAAALAEGWLGGAKKLKSYAVITLGTGIGTGVIFNLHPVQTGGMGSEFGHLIIREKENLTVEQIASGTGIIKRAQELIQYKGSHLEQLSSELKSGFHPEYQVLFDEAGKALGTLCYNLSIGFHLEAFFFSGGMISIKELLWPSLTARYKSLIDQFNPNFRAPLKLAQTKNNAGVLGAAKLTFSSC